MNISSKPTDGKYSISTKASTFFVDSLIYVEDKIFIGESWIHKDSVQITKN